METFFATYLSAKMFQPILTVFKISRRGVKQNTGISVTPHFSLIDMIPNFYLYPRFCKEDFLFLVLMFGLYVTCVVFKGNKGKRTIFLKKFFFSPKKQ